MEETSEKKPRRIILMGRSRAGKTSLLQALHNETIEYRKTQEVIIYDDAIDTPGEYIDQPGLWRACITQAADADVIVLVHDAGNDMGRIPHAFNMTFAKPTIGVITKIDIEGADREVARTFLELAGAKPIFEVSAFTGEGIDELREYIETMDLTDY